MNLDRTFLISDLPEKVSKPIRELTKEHVIGLVADYNDALRSQGQYLEVPDQEELARHLFESAKIKLKIAAVVDEDKLSQWHIYPTDANQSRLDEYEDAYRRRQQAAAEQGGSSQ
ncbi:hypothetical protein [Methanolobus psychrotolerans]|uniref:hypothetical protein n=1 Tax=Methanolobus psychrotolerans TaxID=1874706 RepID=UPI000B91A9C7|nr:hypothetical protein [Methanolobus psychrotolerans]